MFTAPEFVALPLALPGCALCQSAGGVMVWQDTEWRVIRAEDADFPACYRVVLRRHVAELSELSTAERLRCMALVVTVEQVLIRLLQPAKINLAALGNMVPHLHWHVIARFDWDSHFPQAVWAERRRVVLPPPLARLPLALAQLDAEMAAALRLV